MARYAECAKLIDGLSFEVYSESLEKTSEIFSVEQSDIGDDIFGRELGRRSLLISVDSASCEEFYVSIQEQMNQLDVVYEETINCVLDFIRFEYFVSKNKHQQKS